jgi:hypothetical protein
MSAVSEISMENISFEKGVMQMAGPIIWDHPIGRLHAQEAQATLLGKGLSLPDEITLQREVEITLANKDVLLADFAKLSASKGSVLFHGTSTHKVRYENAAQHMRVESLALELYTQGPFRDKRPKMRELIAEGQVVVHVEAKGQLQADKVVLFDTCAKGRFQKALITCKKGRCCFTTAAKDVIETGDITWDMVKDQLVMVHPKGAIEEGGRQLYFIAENMILKNQLDTITLTPPIKLWGAIKLESQGELTLEKGAAKKLICQGPSVIRLIDAKTSREHQLIAPARVTIDHTKMEALIEGAEEEQVHFEDGLGDIWADHAQLIYVQKGDAATPKTLKLQGRVKIQNAMGVSMQYALADEALLNFDDRTLELIASQGSRVLFCDPLHKVQASAHALLIKRDPDSKKSLIKAEGDARFEFAEDELQEFKKRFLLDDKRE